MQTLEGLKRKVKSAEDLQSVVRTMKALAAVSIRQYERAVESLADYNRTVLLGLQVALKHNPRRAVGQPSRSRRLGAVVFGSDQGMCGQLNDQVVAYALDAMDQLGVGRDDRTVLAIGDRPSARLQDAGQPVEDTFSVPGSIAGITPSVQEVLVRIQEWNAQREIEQIVLYYSEQLSGAAYEARTLRLLPVDREWLENLEKEAWPTHILPTFTMDWDQLFSALIREYLFVSLYRAFAESLASENASRLASMQGAEKNIEERLRQLKGEFHQQRQMTITEELLDIVSGFEALSGSA